jgi:hypothetical protein
MKTRAQRLPVRPVLPTLVRGVGAALLAAVLAAPSARAGDLSDAVHQALRQKDESTQADVPPPSRDEIARNWDVFLTAVVKHAGRDAPPGALREDLLQVLIDQRKRIVSLLTDASVDGPDLVNSLFQSSWQQLEPVLDRLADALPPEEAHRYRSFVEAGDLMRAAQRLGVARNVAASPESLRKLAAILLDERDGADPLRFDTAVDPELRRIFGFGPPLPPPTPSPLLAPGARSPGAGMPGTAAHLAAGVLGWLFPEARAAEVANDRTALIARLNTWIPGRRNELRRYVPLVHDLLHLTADATLEREAAGTAADDTALFQDIVVTTAWQESCWRQFVRREGEVEPLVGPAGSVGLMQINAKVWRGLYDPAGLEADIGYNGLAGTQILWHYMRDFAMADGGTQKPEEIARATYAAYNGGPAHVDRIHKRRRSPQLEAIDRSFWAKFKAVKSGDDGKMLACYPTGG